MFDNLKTIHDYAAGVGSNSVSVFGGDLEGGYHLQQDIVEISSFLFDCKSLDIKDYIEIGVASAGLTRLMCDVLSINNVFTLDLETHPSIPEAYENNIKNLKNRGTFQKFVGDSHSSEAFEWIRGLGRLFDFAFIDGDHSYDGVLKDTLLVREFANQRCIFAYHDHACVEGIGNLCSELRQGKHGRFDFIKEYVGTGATKKGIMTFRYMGV